MRVVELAFEKNIASFFVDSFFCGSESHCVTFLIAYFISDKRNFNELRGNCAILFGERVNYGLLV